MIMFMIIRHTTDSIKTRKYTNKIMHFYSESSGHTFDLGGERVSSKGHIVANLWSFVSFVHSNQCR